MAQQPAGNDAQAIAAAVAAAVEQVMQNLPAPAAAAPAAAAPGPFAKTPAQAIANEIDMGTKIGQAVYKENTAKLPTTFVLSKPDIPVLLDELTVRARAASWQAIFLIVVDNTVHPPATKDMLTSYGEITYQQCRDHGQTYIATQTREAQNNYQLFECLRATLDTASRDRLANDESKYKIGDDYDGVTYLHVILHTAAAGSRATAGAIRKDLSDLEEYIQVTVHDDIPQFNDYVKKQRRRLLGLGQDTTDLIDHMFTAYLTVNDPQFKSYVSELQSKYDDGEDINVDTLLEKTEAKYLTLTTRKQWKVKTPEQEEIIALKAQLTNLKKSGKKRDKKESGSTDNTSDATADAGNNEGTSSAKKKKKKGKGKKHTGKWAWKNDAPTDGKETKEFDGKTYKYCCLHKWSGHASAECKVLNDESGNQTTANSATADITSSLAAIGIDDVTQE